MMYDIDLRNIKKERNFGLVFFIAGLIFFLIIASFTFGGIIKKITLDSEVKATNIDNNCYYDSDGQYMCSPIYTYYVNGKRYTCENNFSSSTTVDQNKDMVYYDSKNPSNCVIEYNISQPFYMYLICLFPLIFVSIGLIKIIDVNKRIKKIKYLEKYGTLVKGLPYTMETTGMEVNERPIYAPVVNYTLPSGEIVKLKGQGRFDHKTTDNDGLVDLLIDLNNPTNYYIDFEINRKI